MQHQDAPETPSAYTITAGSKSFWRAEVFVKELMVLSVILTAVVVAIYISFA